MREDSIRTVVGKKEPGAHIMECYSQIVCEFLDDLSKWIRHNKEASLYQDIATVGFWCRKSNIERLKREFKNDGRIHMGRGLVFHVAPSNVPVNFVFSWFFGMLSGNSNIVRLPSKSFPQTEILCKGISELLSQEKYKELSEMTQFISYEKDKEITDYYSEICDGRIIWGGDLSIGQIRESKLKPKAVEIVFADRYSFAVIQSEKVVRAGEDELKQLAKNFYNDTYLMDQNACSTPHMVLWLGNEKEEAAQRFWPAVKKAAEKYEMQEIKVMDKYTDLCMCAMKRENILSCRRYENLLYVVTLSKLPDDMESLRGRYGMFFECEIESLEDIKRVITTKSQSMMAYGIEKCELERFIIDGQMQGIDRIVPFGKALDMGVIWDGYDIVSNLSRVITIEG